MAGTGVPDEYTIASLLSMLLNIKCDINSYDVTNFGTGSFIIEQDMQLLLDEIRKGNLPNIAVFYNGANDTYAGVYSPGKPGWFAGSEEIERKLLAKEIFYPSYKKLHLYQLLGKLKSCIITKDNITCNSKHHIDNYNNKSHLFIKRYLNNLLLLNNIANNYSIKVIFIWQPVLLYGNKFLNEFEKAMVDNHALLDIGSYNYENGKYQKRAIESTYKLVEHLSQNNFYNFSHIFDNYCNESIYIDWVHLGPKGNNIVASKIADIIKNDVIFLK